MPTYTPYQGYTYQAKNLYKQLHHQKLHHQKLEQLLYDIIRHNPGTPDTVTILHEMTHYLLSHKIIYIPTPLAEKFANTNLNLPLDHINIKHHLFELCFDNDYHPLPNYPTPSALIGIRTPPSITDSMHQFLRNALGPDIQLRTQGLIDTISIRYRAPEGGICHANIPTHHFQGHTVDQVIDTLGDINEPLIQPLNQQDKIVNKQLTRITLAIMAYWNTTEPDITTWKNRNRPTLGIKPTEWLIGQNLTQQKWFIRSGGPVILAHKRYKRDEQGNTRIIWRRPAQINPQNNPAHPTPKITQIPGRKEQ